MKISEVLHRAADKYLAADDYEYFNGKEKYSCLAVIEAAENTGLKKSIMYGLNNMGCNTSANDLFVEYGDRMGVASEEVQGMRYFWLKWAALMAEEQGV